MRAIIKRLNAADYLVTLEGTLTGDSASTIFAEILRSTGKSKRLVLDIDHLEHINSGGIGGLLKMRKTIKAEGGVLFITPPQGAMRTIFRTLKLETLFHHHPSTAPDASVVSEIAA